MSGARQWALRLIGPAIGLLLLTRIDLTEVLRAVRSTRGQLFVLAVVLFLPLLVAKAARWRLLLREQGVPLPFARAAELYALGSGLATITPAGAGDLVKGLASSAGGWRSGLWSSALDRVYDVGFLFVLAVSLWFGGTFPRLAVGLLVGIVVLPWGLTAGLRQARRFVPALPDRFVHGTASAIAAAALTVLGLTIALVRFALLALAMNLPLDLRQVSIAFVLSTGVVALPLSIAGFGTRDAVLVAYFGTFGIGPESAVALSTLCLGLYAWNGIVGAAIWLARGPALIR